MKYTTARLARVMKMAKDTAAVTIMPIFLPDPEVNLYTDPSSME